MMPASYRDCGYSRGPPSMGCRRGSRGWRTRRGWFKGVDFLLEAPPEFIAIDEKPNHQIMHVLCLGKYPLEGSFYEGLFVKRFLALFFFIYLTALQQWRNRAWLAVRWHAPEGCWVVWADEAELKRLKARCAVSAGQITQQMWLDAQAAQQMDSSRLASV